MIERRTAIYDGPGGPFEGLAAFDPAWRTPRPGVMIVPNVLGQKEQDNLVACPDPDERLVMRIERIGERTLVTEDLT